jgi:hypothetical protein
MCHVGASSRECGFISGVLVFYGFTRTPGSGDSTGTFFEAFVTGTGVISRKIYRSRRDFRRYRSNFAISTGNRDDTGPILQSTRRPPIRAEAP